MPIVSAGSLLCLALLGFLGAKTGGAKILKPIVRVTFWGALAMAVTAGSAQSSELPFESA